MKKINKLCMIGLGGIMLAGLAGSALAQAPTTCPSTLAISNYLYDNHFFCEKNTHTDEYVGYRCPNAYRTFGKDWQPRHEGGGGVVMQNKNTANSFPTLTPDSLSIAGPTPKLRHLRHKTSACKYHASYHNQKGESCPVIVGITTSF